MEESAIHRELNPNYPKPNFFISLNGKRELVHFLHTIKVTKKFEGNSLQYGDIFKVTIGKRTLILLYNKIFVNITKVSPNNLPSFEYALKILKQSRNK